MRSVSLASIIFSYCASSSSANWSNAATMASTLFATKQWWTSAVMRNGRNNVWFSASSNLRCTLSKAVAVKTTTDVYDRGSQHPRVNGFNGQLFKTSLTPT
eukprot:IDg2828t1